MFSVVCKDGGMQVRARNRKHLETLCRRFERKVGRKKWVIKDTPNADYCARITLDRVEWAALARSLAEEIVWPNFKDECAKAGVDADYIDTLHTVWHRMMMYQRRSWPRVFGSKDR